MIDAKVLKEDFADFEKRLNWKLWVLIVGGLANLVGICVLLVVW